MTKSSSTKPTQEDYVLSALNRDRAEEGRSGTVRWVNYTGKNKRGNLVPCSMIWIGKKAKCSHHAWFMSEEQRDQHLARVIATEAETEKRKAEYKARRKAPHVIPEGAIVYQSSGYDQTNISFFKVVKASTRFVWLRELKAHKESSGPLTMCGTTTPYFDQFTSDEVIKLAAHEDRVNFRFGGGGLWDGEPLGYSEWG
jgi:hypothetical protein